MKKCVIGFLLCLLITINGTPISSVANAVSADISISPLWVTLTTLTLNMTYSSGQVNWTGMLSGNSSTTASITATYKLEKRNTNGSYSLVQTWSGFSTTGTYMLSSGSKTTSTGTYRLTVTAQVRNNSGNTETVTDNLIKTFN
jgi:hypothetical protein